MQQTKSYWRLVAVTGIVSAFIASACVVTTSTDGDNGGADGQAGASAGGSSAAGAAGAHAGAATAGAGTAGAATAGSGGAPALYQCDMGEGGAIGTPLSCVDPGNTTKCQQCIEKNCCAEYSACYATDPGNQCGYGGPAKLVDGTDNPAGEAWCVQNCIQIEVAKNGTAPDAEIVGTCANKCLSDCPGGVIGAQTSILIGCMLGSDCSADCFGG